MKRGKRIDTWFPFYIDKWLWGSTRHELQNDERAVWVDLMALAAKDDGYIRANNEVAYPTAQLAGMFCITTELLESTIRHCLDSGKLEEIGKGIYRISSWEHYELSDRHKRRMSASEDTLAENADTKEIMPDIRGEERREEENRYLDKTSSKPRKPKSQRVFENTPLMIRIGSWFRRKPTNLWTLEEKAALDRMGDLPADEIVEMEAFYKAPPNDKDFPRHDLITLLNNWPGELDKARRRQARIEQKKTRGF